MPPGALIGARLLDMGEDPIDPLVGSDFDPERAAAEYAAHQDRYRS